MRNRLFDEEKGNRRSTAIRVPNHSSVVSMSPHWPLVAALLTMMSMTPHLSTAFGLAVPIPT